MNIASILRFSPLGPYHSAMYGKSLYFDITKAKKELKWTPKYSNNDMIKESYDWYVNNREKLSKSISQKSAHKSNVKQGILYIIGKML